MNSKTVRELLALLERLPPEHRLAVIEGLKAMVKGRRRTLH